MGITPSKTCIVGDYSTSTWANIFFDCHAITKHGVVLIAYPDGECYYEQEQLTIDVFNILRDEVMRAIAASLQNQGQ